MPTNDLLFNPLIPKKSKERLAAVLLDKLPLPFSVENMTGDGTSLLLTGREGRIRYQEGRLTSQSFHSHYTLSPTYFAGRSAAISEDDGSVGIFYSEDGDSYYRLRGQDPQQPFQTKPTSLLQMTEEGLLLFERKPEKGTGRLLYHAFHDSPAMFSDSFLPDEEIIYFKPGARGALALLEGPFSVQLALITPDLQVKEMTVAARNKYLFAPAPLETDLYLIEGRTLVHLSFSPEKRRQEITILQEKPLAIWTQEEILVIVYPDWRVQLFRGSQEVASFYLPQGAEILSVAACQSGLAARTESELLLFSFLS